MFVDEGWMYSDEVEGVRCRLQWRAMKAMFVDESRMDSDEVEGD
jgi:hypothetical protein